VSATYAQHQDPCDIFDFSSVVEAVLKNEKEKEVERKEERIKERKKLMLTVVEVQKNSCERSLKSNSTMFTAQ
jgi:hypothetical protein